MAGHQTPTSRFDQLLANLLAAHRPPWTATDLARAIGCDPTTVQKWVQGKSLPRPKRLAGSIQALGLTSDAARALEEARRGSGMRKQMEKWGPSSGYRVEIAGPLSHVQDRGSGPGDTGQSDRPNNAVLSAIDEPTKRLQRLDTHGALHQAINAVRVATEAGNDSEQALALAKQASAYRYLNELPLVIKKSTEVFTLLGLADLVIGSGDAELIFAEVTKRLGPVDSDPTKWQAYQEAVVNRAFSYSQNDQNRERLDMATAYFTQARLAADQLGDQQGWATATHELGKVDFERYSVPDRPIITPDGLATTWRSPRDREGLLRGRTLLLQAIAAHRRSGALDLGHALRHLGRLEETLGHQDEASRYFFQADEFYQHLDPRQRVNFLVDTARWHAKSRLRHRVVEDLLFQMVDLAVAVDSRQMLAYAYMQLAHLYADHGESEFPRCRRYLAAALLLWPYAVTHRNFHRTVIFYGLMGGIPEMLPLMASSADQPFDVVGAFFQKVLGPPHVKRVQEVVSMILAPKRRGLA